MNDNLAVGGPSAKLPRQSAAGKASLACVLVAVSVFLLILILKPG